MITFLFDLRFTPQQGNQVRMLVPAQQNRIPLQQQRPPQYPTSGGGAKWHIPQQSSSGKNASITLYIELEQFFMEPNRCFLVFFDFAKDVQ